MCIGSPVLAQENCEDLTGFSVCWPDDAFLLYSGEIDEGVYGFSTSETLVYVTDHGPDAPPAEVLRDDYLKDANVIEGSLRDFPTGIPAEKVVFGFSTPFPPDDVNALGSPIAVSILLVADRTLMVVSFHPNLYAQEAAAELSDAQLQTHRRIVSYMRAAGAE